MSTEQVLGYLIFRSFPLVFLKIKVRWKWRVLCEQNDVIITLKVLVVKSLFPFITISCWPNTMQREIVVPAKLELMIT